MTICHATLLSPFFRTAVSSHAAVDRAQSPFRKPVTAIGTRVFVVAVAVVAAAMTVVAIVAVVVVLPVVV